MIYKIELLWDQIRALNDLRVHWILASYNDCLIWLLVLPRGSGKVSQNILLYEVQKSVVSKKVQEVPRTIVLHSVACRAVEFGKFKTKLLCLNIWQYLNIVVQVALIRQPLLVRCKFTVVLDYKLMEKTEMDKNNKEWIKFEWWCHNNPDHSFCLWTLTYIMIKVKRETLNRMNGLPGAAWYSSEALSSESNSICSICLVQTSLQSSFQHVSSDRVISSTVTSLHCTFILGPGSFSTCHTISTSFGGWVGRTVEVALQVPREKEDG